MSEKGTCFLCGHNPARGHATVTMDDGEVIWLCHGSEQKRSCYVLWTVYGDRP